MKNIITNKIMTMVIVISFLFTLIMTGCVDDETPSKDTITPNDITWTATANDTKNTTAIDFTFSASVSGLTANNISITNETGFLTTGALTGSGTSWSLAVNIVSGGDVSVSINKSGIESGSKTVEVFKTLPAELVGRWHLGSNEAAPFMYEFLENCDFITAAGYSGLKISADKNIITISLNGDTVGSATFSISGNEMTLSNIIGTSGLVPGVHFKRDITYTSTVNNALYSTAINFEFSHSISGLTADHIKITNGSGVVTRGELTGGETSWTVAITVATAGDIWVWIEKPGVDSNPKSVTVDNTITWIATVDSDIGTTTVNFEFIAPVSELITSDILITDGTGSVTKGALTGEGTSWSIAVSVKSVGNINVSISKLGIENKIETIAVQFISWTIVANNNKYTTAINIEFDHPVSELKFEQITIANGTASVIRRALMGNDTSWLQVIDVKNLGSGDISISITKPGIENKTEIVTVSKNIMVSRNIIIKADGSLWRLEGSLFQIGSDTNWVSISAVGPSFAIKADGSLWGLEGYSPFQIGSDTDWVSVSSYYGDHSVAIKTDGSLWAWGYNGEGQLGDGTTINRDTPTRIGSSSDWLLASAGSYSHTIAIKKDNSLWAWGQNGDGQLGDGTYNNRNTPTRIGSDTDWISIFTGHGHNVAIKTDGSLWAWGFNGEGQLGDGTYNNRNTPTRTKEETDWINVSAGYLRTMAIKTDGTLWAWGSVLNNNNTPIYYNTPIQLWSESNWVSVFTDHYFIFGIKSDGSLWVSQYGEIPIQITMP